MTREPWFASLRFALLRVLAKPLTDDPPRNRWFWLHVWLPLMERRYDAAEQLWGRERACVYDYIPF